MARLRPALQSARPGSRTSIQFPLPAPTGGWNARDNWANMAPTDAVTLDNFIPDVNCVRLRMGDTSYATSLGSDVETIITHISPTAEKLLCAAGGTIYNISSAGAGSSLATGLSNARFTYANFGGVTTMCNGADVVKQYDGSTISNPAFTGVTLSDLTSVSVVRNRLWFTETGVADVWYGGIGSITGALTAFQLSQIAEGGYTVRVAQWSRDAGDGMGDFTVFIMSTGEVIVYAGDPATDFTLVGKFKTSPPIGTNCFVQRGGDLIIITQGGYISLSLVLQESMGREFSVSSQDISSKIRNAVKEASDSYKNNFGWQAYQTPDEKFLYFNVPLTTNSSYHQHVFNNLTGAWCRFKDRNARCFGSYKGDVYFGGNATVYKANDGFVDVSNSSANIVGTGIQAFSEILPAGPQGRMQVVAIAPSVETSGSTAVTFGVKSDYDVNALTSGLQTINASLKTWSQITVKWSEWDDVWGEGQGVVSPIIPTFASGNKFAPAVQISGNNRFAWYSSRIIAKRGGLI